MIKKSFLLLLLLISTDVFSQVSVRGSMGINFMNTPSLKDYINENFAPPGDQLGSFSTAVSFSGEVGYRLKPAFEIGLEMSYLLNSFTYSLTGGKYEFAFSVLQPSVIAYYVIEGSGYNVKLGGGAGPRFTMAEQTLPFTNVPADYSSTGFGLLLKLDGNTSLGGNLYANIGADIRYDINGEPANNGNNITWSGGTETLNLNSLIVGVRLGVSYIF